MNEDSMVAYWFTWKEAFTVKTLFCKKQIDTNTINNSFKWAYNTELV